MKHDPQTTKTTACRPSREVPPGKKVIWRPWKTLPDGTRIHARQYGIRAFRFEVDE